MKPKKIDLNKWELVYNIEDLDGYQGLIIIPKRLVDGRQLPDMYFRKDQIVSLIENTTNIIWYKDCFISNKGTDFEYSKLVDWWFDSALKDEEYKTIINDTFNRNGFDVKISWEKAKNWLKTCVPSERKTHIHKFIWNWLSKGMTWQLNRLEKDRKKI
jgi:hypothetical protein